MYVNLKNLFELPEINFLPLLLVLYQASKKDVHEEIKSIYPEKEDLDYLESNGFIKYIKGTKNQDIYQKLRLDKKGKEFLKSLEEPSVEEEDLKIFDWLSDIYKKREKQIGNGKKTKYLIAAFREKSGIEKNRLAFLCNCFINDENEQEYSHKLEYVFWKPKNVFQVKFILEDSRLWNYYQKNKSYFDNKFKNID